MILNIHHDSLYLCAPKAKNHTEGHFFLGWLLQNKHPIKLNGPIYILTSLLQFFSISAAEAELGALVGNSKEAKILCHILEEMEHPHHPHQFTVTIPQTLELQMVLSRNNFQNQWRNNTFGLQIRFHKSISQFIGTQVKIILLITSLNITQQQITLKSDPTICISSLST